MWMIGKCASFHCDGFTRNTPPSASLFRSYLICFISFKRRLTSVSGLQRKTMHVLLGTFNVERHAFLYTLFRTSYFRGPLWGTHVDRIFVDGWRGSPTKSIVWRKCMRIGMGILALTGVLEFSGGAKRVRVATTSTSSPSTAFSILWSFLMAVTSTGTRGHTGAVAATGCPIHPARLVSSWCLWESCARRSAQDKWHCHLLRK